MKLNWKKELLQIVGIGLIGVLFNFIFFSSERNYLIIAAFVWIFLSKGNAYIAMVLNRRIDWIERPILRVVTGILAALVYSVVIFKGIIIVGVGILEGRSILGQLTSMNWGDLTFTILLTLVISMFFHGRAFYINWKEALLKVERLKTENIKTQYASLKNQVNPHFLFNSLNALSSLVYDDQRKAVDFIQKLSLIYRYVLDHKDVELVTIQDEFKFLNDYVFLQQIRFEENLKLSIEDPLPEGMVAPIAIQLLVENAIKHNVISDSHPLEIKIWFDEDWIYVWNNVKEKKTKDSTGIGLKNIQSRYSYLSNKEVKIDQNDVFFQVAIPILHVKSES